MNYETLTYHVSTEVRAIGGDHLGTNVIAIKERKLILTYLPDKSFLQLKPPFCTPVNISLTYSTAVNTVDWPPDKACPKSTSYLGRKTGLYLPHAWKDFSKTSLKSSPPWDIVLHRYCIWTWSHGQLSRSHLEVREKCLFCAILLDAFKDFNFTFLAHLIKVW